MLTPIVMGVADSRLTNRDLPAVAIVAPPVLYNATSARHVNPVKN